MITVMGATGHTGKKITETLLKAGQKVRAIARSADKLAALKPAGAEVFVGDSTHSEFLTKAFRGADAVYTLLPTGPHEPDYRAAQDKQGQAIVRAIRESAVSYVVALSSVGADLSEGTGLIQGLHEQEARLKALTGVNILILRPASFFENFEQHLALIEQQGIIADSVTPDLAIPMVATRDIADVAAKALQARNWEGVVVRELFGPRNISHNEAARILGERLGKRNLAYVHTSYDDMAKALAQAGLSENFGRLYGEMTRAINEGRMKLRRTPENTTPTRFEDFAEELAHAYQAV